MIVIVVKSAVSVHEILLPFSLIVSSVFVVKGAVAFSHVIVNKPFVLAPVLVELNPVLAFLLSVSSVEGFLLFWLFFGYCVVEDVWIVAHFLRAFEL